MEYSRLFGKTLRQAPKDEVAESAKLLIRAGFIAKEASGVYNFLPLGLRVLNKIAQIIREEMKAVGGQEMLMATLQNKASWEKTGRFKTFDALFKVKSRSDVEYALGPTHEEVLVPLARHFIHSYKDLPLYLYQIQTKFRDEPRAKSGILRTREFLMKDLYSFHENEADFKKYYEVMKGAYRQVFNRLGLEALEVEASGGTFSQFSHEYQVLTEAGEDTIFYCPQYHFAQNAEIATLAEGGPCPKCGGKIKKEKGIEVGNIFPLGDKFSRPFDLTFKDKKGKDQPVIMGCYGIGLGRAMGTIVEVHHDERGIVWPDSVAPYQIHLVHLGGVHSATSEVQSYADQVHEKLQKANVEVLYDDRRGVSPGEKFADADLIGIPVRLVISNKTLRQGSGQADKVEWKARAKEKTELLTLEETLKRLGRKNPEV